MTLFNYHWNIFPLKGPDVEDMFHRKVEMTLLQASNSPLIGDKFPTKKYVNRKKNAKIQRGEADKIIYQKVPLHMNSPTLNGIHARVVDNLFNNHLNYMMRVRKIAI